MSQHQGVMAACVGTLALLVLLFGATVGQARSLVKEFGATLSDSDRERFEKWYFARLSFGAATDTYWRLVERKRAGRRRKRRRRIRFTKNDYVKTLPPAYNGPSLGRDLAKRWQAFRRREREPTPPSAGLPDVSDYLAAAKRHYNFVPERIPETEFKRRYAREALAIGLSKDQVVRVYALETGGLGTADMQAGIHPISRKGRPISSALGYAQLLSANTINVISKHGRSFVKRLDRMARRTSDPSRRAALRRKSRALRAMVRTAKSIPHSWSRQRRLARTSRGMGLHPLNIDGDIGPWLQIVKLAELKQMAERRGHNHLSGAEIELMNLAGPGTGLEMMLPVAKDKPTTNFFARRAYNRNTIVRGKSAAELLVALDDRMQANIKNSGAQEFLRIFDELIQARRRASRD